MNGWEPERAAECADEVVAADRVPEPDELRKRDEPCVVDAVARRGVLVIAQVGERCDERQDAERDANEERRADPERVVERQSGDRSQEGRLSGQR